MIRVDLPKSQAQVALEEYAAAVLDHVLRLGDAERLFFVVFTHETHVDGVAPYALAIDQLARQARRLDFEIAGGACVAESHWSEYWGSERGPRSEVESELAPLIPHDITEATEIEPAAQAARERVAELLAEHEELAEITDDEVLCAWNLFLNGARWLDPEYEPILIALVSRGLRRLRTLELLVANGLFGSDIAERVEAVWLDLADEMPETELTGLTELFSDFVPADLHRVEQSSAALRTIVSHVDDAHRGPALAALAWLNCGAARASLGQEYARRALRLGHHPLAASVLAKVDDGYVPGWVLGAGCAGPGVDLDGDVAEETAW